MGKDVYNNQLYLATSFVENASWLTKIVAGQTIQLLYFCAKNTVVVIVAGKWRQQ